MSLEQLWAGWRNDYVVRASRLERDGRDSGCVFCDLLSTGAPSEANGIVAVGPHAFTVLNAYPYASGHLLVLPKRHLANLDELSEEEGAEVWDATRRAARALQGAYEPDGINIGANLGRAAGAGIPTHLHLHVLPRWSGDTNFMTTVAGVRVIPEAMDVAWRRLREANA